MRFKVGRASLKLSQYRDKQPCEGAVLEDDGNWYVWIENISELMYFIKKVGHEVIINEKWMITIYDDYIE